MGVAIGALLGILLFLRGGVPASGQAVASAQITGIVTDSSGATIPNAQVKVTQTNTGLVRTTVSGPAGTYLLANLPVGAYELEVNAPGFRRYLQSGIELHVANKVQINVTLQIGSLSQQVEVTANASMVEIHSTSISQGIGQRRIIDLPLNGRQATQLVLLAGASQNVTGDLPGRFDLSLSGGVGKQYPTEVPISVAGGQANGTN